MALHENLHFGWLVLVAFIAGAAFLLVAITLALADVHLANRTLDIELCGSRGGRRGRARTFAPKRRFCLGIGLAVSRGAMKIRRLVLPVVCLPFVVALACGRDRDAAAPDEEMTPASGTAAPRTAPAGAGSTATEDQVKEAKPRSPPPRGQNPWGATGYGAPLNKTAPPSQVDGGE